MRKVTITEAMVKGGTTRGEAHIVMCDPLSGRVLFDKWLPATLRYVIDNQHHVTLDRELGVFGADWNIEPDCWRSNDQE